MEFLAELWLPIVLAAVLVFVASSILHMLLPIHRGNYGKLAGEDQVLETMRDAGVTPGLYMFPCAESMKETTTPEMIEKFKRGPVGHLTVLPSGPPAMGKNLVQWFHGRRCGQQTQIGHRCIEVHDLEYRHIAGAGHGHRQLHHPNRRGHAGRHQLWHRHCQDAQAPPVGVGSKRAVNPSTSRT